MWTWALLFADVKHQRRGFAGVQVPSNFRLSRTKSQQILTLFPHTPASRHNPHTKNLLFSTCIFDQEPFPFAFHPALHCPLPTAYCLLPTAYCLLPTKILSHSAKTFGLSYSIATVRKSIVGFKRFSTNACMRSASWLTSPGSNIQSLP